MNAQKEGDEDADDLVGGEEEDRGHRDHDEHHDGGDRGLTTGRPVTLAVSERTSCKNLNGLTAIV